MDFDETVRALDSFVGKLVLVYPVDEPPEGEQPSFMEGLSVWGTFERYPDATAPLRRSLSLSGFYARTGRHEVDLGDAPLELYERQEAAYGFEGMADLESRFAGFTLSRHNFVESVWLDLGGRFHWLWIKTRPVSLVVAEEFEPPPGRADRSDE